MDHLRTLRGLNLAYAFLLGAVAVLVFFLWGLGGILAIRDGEPMGWLFLGVGLVTSALLAWLVAVHARLARTVPDGRGRVAQTALALLHVWSFPLGTAYALYALWICWVNAPTKTRFDLRDRKL